MGEGNDIRILPVAEVCLFHAADKYTLVRKVEREWVILTPLKELEDELDPELFWSVQRYAIVRVAAIELAHRDVMGQMSLTWKFHQADPENERRTDAHWVCGK